MVRQLETVVAGADVVTGHSAGFSNAGSPLSGQLVDSSYERLWLSRLNSYGAYSAFRQEFDKLIPEEKAQLGSLLEGIRPLTPNRNITLTEAAGLVGRTPEYVSSMLKTAGAPSVRNTSDNRSRRLFGLETVFSVFYEHGRVKSKKGHRRKLSAEDLREIVLLANCGVKRSELAELYHVSHSTVYQVLSEASRSGTYDMRLVKEVKLRNAIMAYKAITEKIRKPVERYITNSLLASVPLKLGPYELLLDGIRPGTSEYFKENLAQAAEQTAIPQTFEWLKQADFVKQAENGSADVAETVRSQLEKFYEEFFHSLIPESLLGVIDAGLSELEQLTYTGTKKPLNWGAVVHQYFFEQLSMGVIGKQFMLSPRSARSAMGHQLSKGVGWLTTYIDQQLGYGSLEALLRASVEERLRTNAQH